MKEVGWRAAWVAAPPVLATTDTLRREPKGGTLAYSDEAYARAKGEPK